MSAEEGKYKLNPYELEIELGVGADLREVEAQAELISSQWKDLPTPEHPTLLLMGGFQGSGKTTVLDVLQPSLNAAIISPDEIRHNLFAKGHQFSQEFARIVNAAKFELIKRAVEQGHSAVVDQSLTPDRVALAQRLIDHHSKYRFLTVFLTAPTEVLKERVSLRPELPGRYKGTFLELESSMEKYESMYGDPQVGGYDLIIDSSTNDPQAIAGMIEERLVGV